MMVIHLYLVIYSVHLIEIYMMAFLPSVCNFGKEGMDFIFDQEEEVNPVSYRCINNDH
jgi:hypothetical protein